VSQVRIAKSATELHAARIGEGAVDLLLGAGLVVSAAVDTLARLSIDRMAAVVNLADLPTAEGVRGRDASLPVA
jgi:indolepyruvate ferredoxin oxidoreductase